VHLHGLIGPSDALQHVIPRGFLHDTLSEILTENKVSLKGSRLSRQHKEERLVVQGFKKEQLLKQK
jgi:hypothetical protein